MSSRAVDVAGVVHQLRRAASWHRQLLAAGLAAAAVALGLSALQPAGAATVAVLVAAHDLPSGRSLGAGDVRSAHLPRAAVPAGALTAAASVAGRVLAGALRRGEPLTDVRLLGPALVGRLAADGLVATPVRIADPAAVALLRPGDLVDVLAAAPPDGSSAPAGQAAVVAEAVRVVTVPATDDATAAATGGALVVLATTPGEAAALAQAAVSAQLSVTVRGRG